MFRVSPCPSSGAYICINSLWFYRWTVVVAALLVVVADSCKLLMMGVETPVTC